MAKIIDTAEYVMHIRLIYQEKHGKLKGSFALATAIPRIFFSNIVRRSSTYESLSEGTLYLNSDLLKANIKTTFDGTKLGDTLLEAINRATDYTAQISSKKLVPFRP